MGCFNTTGFLSRVPIRAGDRVVCFPAKVNGGGEDGEFAPWYPFTIVSPVSLPVRGVYNDYGSVADIDRTPAALFVEEVSGYPAHAVFDAVRDCHFSSLGSNLERWGCSEDGGCEHAWNREGCEALLPATKLYGVHDTPVLLFEHERFYDGLTSEAVPGSDEGWERYAGNISKMKSLIAGHPERMSGVESLNNVNFRVFGTCSYEGSNCVPLLLSCMSAGELQNPEGEAAAIVEAVDGMEFEPLMRGGEGEYAFEALNDMTVGRAFRLFGECADEIRRVYNLYHTLRGIPMLAGLSKTAGEQDYSPESLAKFLELASRECSDLASRTHMEDK